MTKPRSTYKPSVLFASVPAEMRERVEDEAWDNRVSISEQVRRYIDYALRMEDEVRGWEDVEE